LSQTCKITNSAYAGELTLVIVTKKDVLVRAQEVFGRDHDVLQNIVEPYAETSANHPEIIYSEPTIQSSSSIHQMTSSVMQSKPHLGKVGGKFLVTILWG
ncbi:hypothetical protein MAR_032858, partial [Mya arenaria]